MIKTCSVCKKNREYKDFYKGAYNKCKYCIKAYQKNYQSNRRKDDEYRKQQKEYYLMWYENNGRTRGDSSEIWHLNNKDKNNIHHKVWYALHTNKIIKPKKCQYCKREVSLSGHHPDYSKPLEVIWLCGSCHKIIHNGVYEKVDYQLIQRYV